MKTIIKFKVTDVRELTNSNNGEKFHQIVLKKTTEVVEQGCKVVRSLTAYFNCLSTELVKDAEFIFDSDKMDMLQKEIEVEGKPIKIRNIYLKIA